jgi:hypothetical protein
VSRRRYPRFAGPRRAALPGGAFDHRRAACKVVNRHPPGDASVPGGSGSVPSGYGWLRFARAGAAFLAAAWGRPAPPAVAGSHSVGGAACRQPGRPARRNDP